jgi:hypothetical protein
MVMQLYPENIRRFVGELTTGKPGAPAVWKVPGIFEQVDPSFPAEGAYQAFLHLCRQNRKGVEMCSTVVQKTAGLSGIHSGAHPNVH